jgi:hypothetical protein
VIGKSKPKNFKKLSHPPGGFFIGEKNMTKESGSTESGSSESTTRGSMTREDALTTIRELAEKLGHPPSHAEVEDMTPVRRRHIRRLFGNYSWALRECGIGPRTNGQRIPTDLLFAEWATVARKLKKVPSITEFEELAKFRVSPFQRRFRHWSRVPEAMDEYAKAKGLEADWQDVLELIRERREDMTATHGKWPLSAVPAPTVRSDRPVYGMAMVPAPMMHEPTNEAGVIFLFGVMAAKLGFMVTLIQSAFPDCEALRVVGDRRCQRVRIEFEHESRNFLKHAHDVEKCDLIVCWNHNWPECPLEVLELKTAISRQHPRQAGAGSAVS